MDDHGSKCTVIRLKMDGLDESKDESGLSKYQSGKSKSVEVEVKSMKVDGLKPPK